MTSPVDPPRRSSGPRRPKKTAAEILDDIENERQIRGPNLPAPVERARPIPSGTARAGGDAAIHAQVIGEKRGLRAGATIHDQARTTYNKTHWSGSHDRRAPKGKSAKTDV